MVQSCRHILGEGTQCAAPALRNKYFCRHHNRVHDWQRRSGLRSQITNQTPTLDYGAIPVSDGPPQPQVYPPIELEFPEDRASIQINLYRIADALARGRTDRPTATALLYAMQVCQTNLGKRPLIEAPPASRPSDSQDGSENSTGSGFSDVGSRPALRTVSRIILTPDGDEIAPPAEILEDNEAEPIHHRLCPCLLCAEKYRNQPPEEHHPDCQCGLCEPQEAETTTDPGAPSLAQPKVGDHPDTGTNPSAQTAPVLGIDDPDPCRPRIARAASLLSGSTNRDPLNRPWSVAEYTFGDAIRRHEAQYAARAAAALAVGIEPPPYEPYITGLLRPGTPEHAEDQQMQQHSSEYWTAHFRKQIAERPDIQRYLDEEAANDSAQGGG